MYNLSVANIHGHMVDSPAASVKQKIAWLHLVRADGHTLAGLSARRTVHADACRVLKHVSCKSGTIHACARVAAAILISSAHKLQGIIHYLLALIAVGRLQCVLLHFCNLIFRHLLHRCIA